LLVLSWQHVDMCIFIRVYVFSECYIDWREREREKRERETCSLVSFLVGTFMAACRYVDI
jgi:dolichol kinase